MQCPKCKKEISNNVLKCDFCGAKVASVCKSCGTVNPITAVECSGCHKILLKICSKCGAANVPTAKNCRKCNEEFSSQIQNSAPKYSPDMNSQQKVRQKLIEQIKSLDTKIITLTAPSGYGKNLVLRYVINDLKSSKLIWLSSSCTQVTQLSPLGYFQDLLLNFFNINNFCSDTRQLRNNSLKFFKQDFPTLSNSEIFDLLNIFYPENTDNYENIYKNKARTFNIMKKVFMTIIEKVKAIFVIDNFEYIDSMSFDFLKELLKDEYILDRSKFIIISRTSKPGMGFISSPNLKEESYTDLSLAPFSNNQTEAMVAQYSDINAGNDFLKSVIKLSAGNPALIEQIIMHRKDIIRNGLTYQSCNTIENLIKTRLHILKKEDLKSYRMLVAFSTLGSKFYPAMLEFFDNNEEKEFERIIENLVEKGYLNQVNNLSFEFKSNEIWKIIVSIVKNDSFFEEIMNQLFDILSRYKQSSIALIGYIVQKLNNNDQAFEIWTLLMKHASYIGDIGLYIISQKQALKLIEFKNSPFYQNVKKNIYTRVGKLLEPIDSESSFEYLQNAVMMLEDTDINEHIELLGYLASVAMKTGNYWGVIECVDNVLSKIPDDMELERVLIKSREVNPLLRLGNYGQVVNLVDTEIIPAFEKYLGKKNTPVISLKDFFDTWLNIYFDLAEALTFQGDIRMFDIIKLLFDIVEKNKITEPLILCKTRLALALANTIKGDVKTSETILDDMLKEFSLDSMDEFIVSRWNFIDILNKFLVKNYDNLYTELFNVVAYANNVNDLFTKNIAKTLLAKILMDKNENKKALSILEEQVSYFAKEKIATGVLLSWYIIAEIRLITKGTQFAMDIANKALDIAQGANINNYLFIAMFNKLLGEIYVAKQDFESAKVYIEKAIFISKKFGLEHLLVNSYIQYAKLYQELALPKSSLRGNYIKQALKMFQEAKNVPIVTELPHLQRKIKEELSVLTSFCKLNGIILKRSGN